MKRKIRQIQHSPGGIYVVADDGTWWWLDPLTDRWVQRPNLPDASDSLFGEAEGKPERIREEHPTEIRPIARLKVKP